MALGLFDWDESKGVWITLNENWWPASEMLGKKFWKEARDKNHGNGASKYAKNADGDIRGVRCEIATGQFLNLFPGFGGFVQAIDVGDMVEARSAEGPKMRLTVKVDEKDLPIVCVLCHKEHERRFLLAGWMYATDAKRRYPKQRLPSRNDPTKLTDWLHYVPLKDLRDMHELRKLVDIERTRKAWLSQIIQVFPMAFGEESIHAETVREDQGLRG
jgi:hypothetical protein